MISGYAAVYFDGTPETQFVISQYAVERIMPGAFDETVKQDFVRALYRHRDHTVLGDNSAGTLRLYVDHRGLRYEIPATETGAYRFMAAHIRSGIVKGSSFMGAVVADSWSTENHTQVNWIRKIRLEDVGPSLFPCYRATTVQVETRAQCPRTF